MNRSGLMLAVGTMEDIWHEQGEEIVQWIIDYTDFHQNDLIQPYMTNDDPADIDWDEIFYQFLERFMQEAHTTNGEWIQCSRVIYGETDFIVDTEHLGGYNRTFPAELEDALKVGSGVGDSEMTSWSWNDDAYLGDVFGFTINADGTDKVMINAIVAMDDVDWATTIATNLSTYWDEYELVIPHNTPVYDIDILRNGEPMVTMEETKAAEWSNATITSSVQEMIKELRELRDEAICTDDHCLCERYDRIIDTLKEMIE